MHFILCQRERKRHWVVCRVRPCELCFRAVNHFILGGRCPWVSKHHSDCMRGEICFKEIVSNIRLNLNHSFFTHLVYEFLIICRFLFFFWKCRFLFIYIVTIYLFIFGQIVSNTRLDLNHSFFTHLVCEFLIICRFLFIYIVSIYLFFLSITFICVIAYILICMLFILLYHKRKLKTCKKKTIFSFKFSKVNKNKHLI